MCKVRMEIRTKRKLVVKIKGEKEHQVTWSGNEGKEKDGGKRKTCGYVIERRKLMQKKKQYCIERKRRYGRKLVFIEIEGGEKTSSEMRWKWKGGGKWKEKKIVGRVKDMFVFGAPAGDDVRGGAGRCSRPVAASRGVCPAATNWVPGALARVCCVVLIPVFPRVFSFF